MVVQKFVDKNFRDSDLELRMLARQSLIRRLSQFVPKYKPPDVQDLGNFNSFLYHYPSLLILTGAGVSTESGIPDYRSEDVGVFSRTSYKPVQYADFMKNPGSRKRYWARNFVGWPRFRSLGPNKVHFFISTLQGNNNSVKLITQNVDGLHSKAGSKDVVELHGNAYWVKCTECNDIIHRDDFQKLLEKSNPGISPSFGEIRPDGDVEIPEENIKNFEVPCCEKCGGTMKPTIVFFGENVPERTAKKAAELVDECEAMLILGTSLSTLSCYRLIEQAYDAGKFLCLVNIGKTRGDKMMDLIIPTRISELITKAREKYSY